MTRTEAAALSWDELEAAHLCECGVPLRSHPPLPTAKPWGEGRPCNRASLAEIGKGRKSDEARLRQLREAQRRHRARPR